MSDLSLAFSGDPLDEWGAPRTERTTTMTNAEASTAAGTAAVTPQGAAGAPTTAKTQKKVAPKAKTGAKPAAKTAPASRKETGAKQAKRAAKPRKPAARDGSKKSAVIELLRRKDGVSATDIAKLTDWQPHYADVRIMPTCIGNPACGAGIAAMGSA